MVCCKVEKEKLFILICGVVVFEGEICRLLVFGVGKWCECELLNWDVSDSVFFLFCGFFME